MADPEALGEDSPSELLGPSSVSVHVKAKRT